MPAVFFVNAAQVSTLEQKTNFLAAYVSAGLSAQLPQLMSQLGVKPRDSFEIGFNRATGLAAAGDLEAAEAAVKAAYKLGELLGFARWFDSGSSTGHGRAGVQTGRVCLYQARFSVVSSHC
jgi:hypothetical protein